MGSLYRQNGRDGTPSGPYWIKFYVNGRAVRESTGTARRKAAERILKLREGAVASGAPILPRADRIRYEEVATDLRQHYEATGQRDLQEADYRLAHLKRFFCARRIATIGQAEATAYALRRQEAGASNASINRELSVLVRMLRLAYERGKLLRLPVIRKLKEGSPRQGFFEPAQYDAVRKHLPDDLQVATAIAYTYGWRTQSEVLTLERRHLDLEAGTLRLDPGMTKNDDGRVVYLTPELKRLLGRQLERVDALQRRLKRVVPYLFPYLSGKKRAGTRRRDFRKAWREACDSAGVSGRLRHDFRRTAVRNLVNAGVPERVAMKITGHRTRAVFDRYHIVSPADLEEAARKLAGHNHGHNGRLALDERRATQ